MSSTTFEDEYEEFEDIEDEDEDEDNTLSGFTVLMMGLIVLGAIFAVAWASYRYGASSGPDDGKPYVTADPEPLKIENKALADASDNLDRAVYDRFDGAPTEPVEVIAEGPEEPVDRNAADPISAIVAANTGSDVTDDAVADRIAALAEADEALRQDNTGDSASAATGNTADAASGPASPSVKPEPVRATSPTPTAATITAAPATTTSVGAAVASALSGSHLVQVGAFRSEGEAMGVWNRMGSKLGSYLGDKTTDIERADLGDRGVYYRLRIGPFASKSAAATYCEGLKERGQDCLVKAK